MKKIIAIILTIFITLSIFAGCGSNSASDDDTFSIVTTIYPEYDWIKNITSGAEGVEATLLLDKGVDLHSYQPTAEDILKISTCDVFIYVGGESDKWVDDALKQSVNKDMVVINLLDILGDSAKEEEIVEGMQPDEEDEEDEDEEPELDEHVWLSLKNAKLFCQTISDRLCEADGKNKDVYTANTTSYISNLDELDGQYEEMVKNAKYRTLLFGDRFPFRYFVDDYNLSYYAAFVGCSAETEASFETIAFLANKLDELNLPAVITIEGSDKKIAQTVIDTSQNKTAEILTMNSMQSKISSEDDYLGIMRNNLEVLKKALKE